MKKSSFSFQPKLVSIISVFTNEGKFVESFMNTILSTSYPAFEIIIIDNASHIETKKKLDRYKDSRLRIVRRTIRESLAKNLNYGVSLSRGEYIVHAEPDVQFPYANWLSELIKAIEQYPEAAGANPMILNQDRRTIQSLGELQTLMHPGWIFFMSRKNASQFDNLSSFEVWGLHGTLALWRKKAVLQAGGFDEELYPVMVEDGDMSWRLKLMGYSFIAVPSVRVAHSSGGSTTSLGSKRKFAVKKNTLRSLLKNMGNPYLVIYLPTWFSIHLYHSLRKRDKEGVSQLFNALAWNVSTIRSTLIARKKVKMKKRVDDMSALKPVVPISFLIREFE